MSDFPLLALSRHFGSDILIGKLTTPPAGRKPGTITAFQASNGQPLRYPDNKKVDDIFCAADVGSQLSKNDWVIIKKYVTAEERLADGRTARLKAVEVQPMVEVGSLGDMLKGAGSAQRKLVSHAIRDIQVIGERVLVLQSLLASERARLADEVAQEHAQMSTLITETKTARTQVDHDRQQLEQERQQLREAQEKLAEQQAAFVQAQEALGRKRSQVRQEQTNLDTARTALQARLAQFGMDEKSLEDATWQPSPAFLDRLMSIDSVQAALRQQRLPELEARERQVAQQLEQVTHKQREQDEAEQRLARQQTELSNLKAALTPRVRKKPEQRNQFDTFASEGSLITHIKQYIADTGFCYEPGLVENFYTCLKAHYLTILAGISGTGKSRLPSLLAEAVGGVCEVIPVRPDWNDDRDLLGYFNVQAQRYQTTRFLECLLRAADDPDRLYIICLDEMNLAPVEYYFAQLLSTLETKARRLNPPDETLTVDVVEYFGEKAYFEIAKLQAQRESIDGLMREVLDREIEPWNRLASDLERYRDVVIPANVRFVGTVNIDHTTHGFSDKVLDRANVIQFEQANLQATLVVRDPKPKYLNYATFAVYCECKPLRKDAESQLSTFVADIQAINALLEPAGLGIGFRVLRDMRTYLHLALQGGYFQDPLQGFDCQIKQRILPKIRGMQSEALQQALEALAEHLKKRKYERSHQKIAGRSRNGTTSGGMLGQLATKGYANYWETR